MDPAPAKTVPAHFRSGSGSRSGNTDLENYERICSALDEKICNILYSKYHFFVFPFTPQVDLLLILVTSYWPYNRNPEQLECSSAKIYSYLLPIL